MTTPTPAQQLEEVLALLEKATPAPWMMDERDIIERTGAMLGIYIARPNGTRILETFANCGIDDEACEANAALIVSLVNAAPLLRRALAALEAVEGAEDCMCSDCNGDGVWHLEPCGFCDGHGNFKMVPAPKSADAVEVSRG